MQEAKGKFAALRPLCPDIELHLIGPLQTNKAEEAVQLFDVIQTIDRPRIAEAVAEAMRKAEPRAAVLSSKVNIGAEPRRRRAFPFPS